jgi:hypothetical protein
MTGERPISAIFRSPCGCRYLMPTGELLRSCEEHAPYGGTAFDAGDLLGRIESELGWPPDSSSTLDPPVPNREGTVDKYEVPQEEQPEPGEFVVFWAPPPFLPQMVEAELADGTRLHPGLQSDGRRLGFDRRLPAGTRIFLRGTVAWIVGRGRA